MEALLKPTALQPGMTVGIVATSHSINVASADTIARSYAYLESKGLRPIEAPNCRSEIGHAAGTIKERADSINEFFRDPNINAILAFWGGYNTNQILEHLDYEMIKNNPKPLIGYSDLTALQIALHSQTNLVTFSGPVGITFGKPQVPKYTWDAFEKVLFTNDALKNNRFTPISFESSEEFSENKWWEEENQLMKFSKTKAWNCYRPGVCEGRLIGGNMGTLLLLAGTQYWPNFENKILFIEDDEVEIPQTIDRCLTHLRQLKVFDQISGLIIGRMPSSIGFKKEDSLEMILDNALQGYDLPVLTEVDFGHTDPLLTLPIGILSKLDATNKVLTLLESAVI